MDCTHPKIIFPPDPWGIYNDGLEVGCGKCVACRIKIRKEKSLRCLHELGYWNDAVFLTLTYSDENVPANHSLKKKHLQDFFKSIRKDLEKNSPGRKIKHFSCGEYGDKTYRPHYHSIVFGLKLNDADKDLVRNAWPFQDWEHVNERSFLPATPETIEYVARYIDKKLFGDMADEIYMSQGRENIFHTQSNGIGKQFALDNAKQIKENGYLTRKGVKYTIPRYYLRDVLKLNKKEMLDIKRKAKERERKKNMSRIGIKETSLEIYKHNINDKSDEIVKLNAKENRQREINLNAKIEINSLRKKRDICF